MTDFQFHHILTTWELPYALASTAHNTETNGTKMKLILINWNKSQIKAMGLYMSSI
jgi:hypothetical protein